MTAPAYPILYSFRRCPYAMRTRMALLASGVICELREVKLSDKPPAMIEASPKATVPVLVRSDGSVIDESLDIMHWALDQNDPEGWLEAEAADLIAVNDGPFKHHLDRYKYPSRYCSDVEEHRQAAATLLFPLEQRLSCHANLARDERSLADFAIMPFVRQFAEVDKSYFESLPLSHLQRWLDDHLGSVLFEHAMIRVPAWATGDEQILLKFGNEQKAA